MKPKRNSSKRIGIFGGTFDPIHMGHLIVASEVRERYSLEKVIFVPTARPPHKRCRLFASPQDRLKMVKLAVKSNPHFAVSEVEQKKEFSYTADTLEYFKRTHPGAKMYLIIGADNIVEIKDWHQPERIFKLAKVVAVRRPKYDLSPGEDRYPSHVIFFPGPEIGISSTQIRKRIKSGKTFQYLVPERVAKYIVENGLYSVT